MLINHWTCYYRNTFHRRMPESTWLHGGLSPPPLAPDKLRPCQSSQKVHGTSIRYWLKINNYNPAVFNTPLKVTCMGFSRREKKFDMFSCCSTIHECDRPTESATDKQTMQNFISILYVAYFAWNRGYIVKWKLFAKVLPFFVFYLMRYHVWNRNKKSSSR